MVADPIVVSNIACNANKKYLKFREKYGKPQILVNCGSRKIRSGCSPTSSCFLFGILVQEPCGTNQETRKLLWNLFKVFLKWSRFTRVGHWSCYFRLRHEQGFYSLRRYQTVNVMLDERLCSDLFKRREGSRNVDPKCCCGGARACAPANLNENSSGLHGRE